MPAPRPLFRVLLPVAITFLAALDLVAVKRGWIPPDPRPLASLAALLLADLALECGLAVADLARGRSAARAGARVLLCGGAAATAALGGWNWARSIEGFVVLVEGETTSLASIEPFAGLERGPWSRPSDLDVELALREVELEAAGGDSFNPVSLLEVRVAGGAIATTTVGGGRVGEAGALLLRQGAFGYAPRIVLVAGGEPRFDRVVPFLTSREGSSGSAFVGDFTIAKDSLRVWGEVLLDPLDEKLRGHPKLRLQVTRQDEPLGGGELRPGEFAEMKDGWRVGFAGLKKWSEVDVSRRNYASAMKIALLVAVAGVLAWIPAAWRSR